jgi:ACR3 family arsenite efflux pump ArsB
LRKTGTYWSSILGIYTGVVYQVFINSKKNNNDLVRREVLCSFLIEFGTPMKLVRVTKICLNKTYGKVWIGKHLYDTFTIYNGLNH